MCYSVPCVKKTRGGIFLSITNSPALSSLLSTYNTNSTTNTNSLSSLLGTDASTTDFASLLTQASNGSSSSTDSLWSSGDDDDDTGLSSMMMQSMNASMANSLNAAQAKLGERAASLQKVVAADKTNTAAAAQLQQVQNNLNAVSNQYNSLIASTGNNASSAYATNNTANASSNLLSALSASSALKQYETQNS